MKAIEFIEEAYKHCKAIAATGPGVELLQKTRAGRGLADKPSKGGSVPKVQGVIVGPASGVGKVATEFIAAIGQHRAWEREAEVAPIE
jgi:catalase